MRTLIALLFVLALSSLVFSANASGLTGSWTADLRDDEIHLVLHRDGDHSQILGRSHDIDRFAGLVAHLDGQTRFSLTAPAGQVDFEGSFKNGKGVGWYELTPDTTFRSALSALGFRRVDDDHYLVFVMEELRIDDVRGMQDRGYDLDEDELLQVAIFRINPAFIDETERLGWSDLDFSTLVQLRVGNVDATFVDGLRRAGLQDLDAEGVAQLAIIGVTPDYINEMSDLGYGGLTAHDYLQMKVLGVDTEFIERLDDAGKRRLSHEELIRFKALGIDDILLEH